MGDSTTKFGESLRDGFKVTSSWLAQNIAWLDDIQLFYRERAIIENEYGSKLSLLAKQYMEKKASKSSVLSVGKTPVVTPGSLESASMTTWTAQLNAIEAQSARHKQFATDIQAQLVDPLRSLQTRYDALRQTQITYARKLEDEKMAVEDEVRKHKSKYDTVCQEVEYRRKKADGDSGRGKAHAAFQQQQAEMHDAKNAYLLSIVIANAQQERYYYDYLPQALDNLQDISENRVGAVNDIWSHAARLELETITATSSLLQDNLADIPRNKPRLDSLMFVQHNTPNWQMPGDIAFEPSAVWHDDSSMVISDRSRNFLRNSLTRAKAARVEKRTELARLKVELSKAWTAVERVRTAGNGAEETEVTKAFFSLQERAHDASSQLVSAETEMGAITAVVGDISVGARTHSFKPDSFKIPVQCDLCADKIWGLSAKGATCSDCGYSCHAKCQMKSPADCPGPQSKEEKKKLKLERQEVAHQAASQISDSASAKSVPVPSLNGSQLTLASAPAASTATTTATAAGMDRSPSIGPRPEQADPPARPAPRILPSVGGRPQRRILAPPPDSYITDSSLPRFEPVKGRAIYSYDAAGPDQMTVHEKDEVVMIEPDNNSGWIKVKCNLSTGLVPKSYIELETGSSSKPRHGAHDSISSIGSGRKKGPAVAPRPGGKKVRRVRALYDYDSTNETTHSIRQGEEVVLINLEASPGWAEVEKDHKVKYVPRNYITEITD